MPQGPTADTAQDEQDAIAFDSFSGLRNTVAPERMGPHELTKAVNVDIDDEEEIRRRRGYRKVMIGQFHSLFQIDAKRAIVVKDGMLSMLYPGYEIQPLLAGIGPAPLSYVFIPPILYCSSPTNSCKIRLDTSRFGPAAPFVMPWGAIVDHSYQPGLAPAPAEWWFSPVSNPEPQAGLGPVAGRLLAPPPPAAFIAYYNGRIYLAEGRNLWATMLYAYDWVDKTSGYRQYEDEITGLASVEDGLYVGTRSGVYFVQGSFGEEKRTLKEEGGVVLGTMIRVPGELVTPEGRRNPDLPQKNALAMSCMTEAGHVIGMPSGDTFNLTRTRFIFPHAARGSSMFRDQDGIAQIITALDAGGTPRDNARIGDYCDATIIRAADRKPKVAPWAEPKIEEIDGVTIDTDGPNRVAVYAVDGTELFVAEDD